MKKKILILIMACLLAGVAAAVTVTKGYTWVDGETITHTKLNSAATPTVALASGDVTGAVMAAATVTSDLVAAEVFSAGKNFLYNGNMDVWQRGATQNLADDDTYTADRWILLAEAGANGMNVTADTSAPTGSKYAYKLEVVTANKKFGILQVLPNIEAMKLWGRYVSLSFQAKTAAGLTISNLRAAVVTWSSTADTVTSDIVSAWGASGVDPTLATNWTYENTPSNLALTNSYVTYKVENAYVDTASGTNVGVFIWSDDTTTTANDVVYIGQVQLEIGDTATPFNYCEYGLELLRCQRYYYVVGGVSGGLPRATGYVAAAGVLVSEYPFPIPMRAAPTDTVAGTWAVSNSAATAPSCDGYAQGYIVYVTATATGATSFNPNSADDTITFDSEL